MYVCIPLVTIISQANPAIPASPKDCLSFAINTRGYLLILTRSQQCTEGDIFDHKTHT